MTITIKPLYLAFSLVLILALIVAGVIFASSGGDDSPSSAAGPSPTLTATKTATLRPNVTTRPSTILVGTASPVATITPVAITTPVATELPPTATALPSPTPTPTPVGVQDAANRLFVDPARGSDNNNGRRATPFLTLQRALEAAHSLVDPEIYVAGGQLNPSGTDVLGVRDFDKLAMYGGFNAETWERDPEQVSAFWTDTKFAIEFSVGEAVFDGFSVRSGPGAAGAPGANGAQGKNGNNGGNGAKNFLCPPDRVGGSGGSGAASGGKGGTGARSAALMV